MAVASYRAAVTLGLPDPRTDGWPGRILGVVMAVDSPPAYAWDWLARQRVAWREIQRRLVHERSPVRRSTSPAASRPGDVPDWSADHPDLLRSSPTVPVPVEPGRTDRDYHALDTRAEVIAALQADYVGDELLRGTVDAVVAEIAFLGRLDVPLHALGVRSAPRGMRWWWCHLGGTGVDDGRSVTEPGDEHLSTMPVQLDLGDVLAGYGDARAS